jgi:hypothetical protein
MHVQAESAGVLNYCLQGCARPLHRSERERGREEGRERKRERERERKRESERERVRCRIWLFLFLKGMTSALAPFGYLVLH